MRSKLYLSRDNFTELIFIALDIDNQICSNYKKGIKHLKHDIREKTDENNKIDIEEEGEGSVHQDIEEENEELRSENDNNDNNQASMEVEGDSLDSLGNIPEKKIDFNDLENFLEEAENKDVYITCIIFLYIYIIYI